jgi:hypothetical protein
MLQRLQMPAVDICKSIHFVSKSSLAGSRVRETHICRSALSSSKSRWADTPSSRCRQVNAPSDTCTQCWLRLRSFYPRSSCCEECPASRTTAADVGRRSGDSRDCSRHRSTANCGRHPTRRSSARRCSCSAGPCPTLASPRYHLFTDGRSQAIMRVLLLVVS